MDIDERQQEREDSLKDEAHEIKMRNDIDYFCEYTLENLYITPKITKGVYLFDVLNEINRHCCWYDQDSKEFLDYLKEI
jgi:hypothetical protein